MATSYTQPPHVPKHAVIYRMLHCPYGYRAIALLQQQGFTIDDHHLSREEANAFKKQHNVLTTPQTFISGQRIGGYDDLQRYFRLQA